MINRDRIINLFAKLVSIDTQSLHEKKMAEYISKILKDIGYNVSVDDAAEKILGDSGNLLVTVKGDPNIDAIVLVAHMDTVEPAIGKKAIIGDEYITSDGSTVLGGDDLAGVAIILELLQVIYDDNIPHGDIYVLFTVAEEIGLLGSKNFDFTKINAKYGFVLDGGGDIGRVAVRAPSQISFDINIKGKAAHAGIEPENGISAIEVVSHAISEMRLGRIDSETTANIGIISGGIATNIVCDKVNIKAEARSLDETKLINQINHMREKIELYCKKYGATCMIEQKVEYPSYDVSGNKTLIDILSNAAKATNIELVLEDTGGGSDTNILNNNGIVSCIISVGMDNIHTVHERIKIQDIVCGAKFLLNIVRSVW
ncbi:MAG: M20/M25/M40 family metallo-hydrolase [Clostridiales bacterium]|nr:M20/M25/M40 family metallo-hydrolase [Clostridiales bacterium]